MMKHFFICLLLCLLIYSIMSQITWTQNIKGSMEKLTAFECGFDSLNSMRAPFSIQFFLLVVLFLIFDIETMLMFPSLNLVMMNSYVSLYFYISVFLMILLLGLFYEWYSKMLDWVK
nr:NADH dehydrogenase subunit 3 [Haplotrema minimum]